MRVVRVKRPLRFTTVFVGLLLAGCGAAGSVASSPSAPPAAAQASFASQPDRGMNMLADTSATVGADGCLWVGEGYTNQIGRLCPTGALTSFSVPTADAYPVSLVLGPDHAVWFAEYDSDQIGRITTAGQITEFAIPGGGTPSAMAAGGGALWFLDTQPSRAVSLDEITPAGVVSEFPLTGLPYASGLAWGAGTLWLTDPADNAILRWTKDGDALRRFVIPTAKAGAEMITAGPDGALWFTESEAAKIGRIDDAGRITEYPIPTPTSTPVGIAAGSDGDLWFADQANNQTFSLGASSPENIGRITTRGVITTYPLTSMYGNPDEMAVKSDHLIWFTEMMGGVGRLTFPSG
jgi:virginiamycin B lyase